MKFWVVEGGMGELEDVTIQRKRHPWVSLPLLYSKKPHSDMDEAGPVVLNTSLVADYQAAVESVRRLAKELNEHIQDQLDAQDGY